MAAKIPIPEPAAFRLVFFDRQTIAGRFIALIGVWCESVGFYVVIAMQEWFVYRRRRSAVWNCVRSCWQLNYLIKVYQPVDQELSFRSEVEIPQRSEEWQEMQ